MTAPQAEKPSLPPDEGEADAEVGVRPSRSEGLVPEQSDGDWNESDHFSKDVS
jgi:hypothetical protein